MLLLFNKILDSKVYTIAISYELIISFSKKSVIIL